MDATRHCERKIKPTMVADIVKPILSTIIPPIKGPEKDPKERKHWNKPDTTPKVSKLSPKPKSLAPVIRHFIVGTRAHPMPKLFTLKARITTHSELGINGSIGDGPIKR
uniref:Uncharacterized protein n=1 Tax=Arion vulgaris TaxID=1028688 RepID=A0A0B6YUT7_9EUPU